MTYPSCHSQCKDIPFTEVYTRLRRADDPEVMPQRFEGKYVVDHHPDCPMLRQAIARGQELAERYRWGK